jgi:hypothetical protein
MTPNEWLDDHLKEVRGRDEMLDEAERIVPLLSDRAIEAGFGRELAGRVNGSVKEGFLEYLEELARSAMVRSSLKAVLFTIDPREIEAEYEEEIAHSAAAAGAGRQELRSLQSERGSA